MSQPKDTSSGQDAALLNEFSAPSLETWQEECERLLRGAPFAKKMFTKTVEGLTTSPMYTVKDIQDLPWLESEPGDAPYVRGTRAVGPAAASWLVAQELPLPTCEAFNNALREDLKRGQTAVNLVLDEAGQQGLDPDQAQVGAVGCDGTSVSSVVDLDTALDGVDLSETPLFVQAGSAALPLAALLVATLRKRGGNTSTLSGCLGSDPIYGLAQHGNIPLGIERLYDEMAALTIWADKNAPDLKTLSVWEAPWHDGGADSALGLGLTLASSVETLRHMQQRDIAPELAAERLQFHLSIGNDFFMEMAKVRALRLLWSRITDACGCGEVAAKVTVHARTSRRTQTLLDTHVNMLRVTTQAMSAVMGGVDSLHVSPFDEVDSLPDEFSRRIARNVQLMLARECHFDHVTDPAGGSWYVEKLTAELAEAAWTVFTDIEKAGGVIEALKSGLVQEKVAAAAALRQERLAVRKDVYVGTNQYANPLETPRTPRTVDCAELHARRAEDLPRQRTAAAHEKHVLILSDLEKIMDASSDRWLDLMTEAASHGATIGELTGILRYDTDSDLTVEAIPLRRDTEPFEILREGVEKLRQTDKPAGRVFTACLGNFARYMPRLDFTRGFYQVGGFEVVGDTFHDTVADVVKAATEAEAGTIVLVGLDDTYKELAVEAAKALAALPGAPTLMLAGLPKDILDDLKAAGVSEFIHMRSNILTVLGQLAASKGVQS